VIFASQERTARHDSQLRKSTEFFDDVLCASVHNPGSLVDTGWLSPTNGLDERKDTRRQRLDGLVVPR